jgi:uncharacterized protein involved in outer membrane biogenesis
MKRAPIYTCRAFKISLGAVLLPPTFWLLALAVIPTDCARQSVVARLEAMSGRKVTLDKIRVGLCGGVDLENLTIGAHSSSSESDPWLKVADAAIDVSLFQLLFGTIEPTQITLHGLDLRLLRKADGQLELADLLQIEPETSAPVAAGGGSNSRITDLRIRIMGSRVTVVDETSDNHLVVDGIDGVAMSRGQVIHVSDLRGSCNGGTVRLAAQLDRSGSEPAFEGELQVQNVALGEGMSVLEWLVPVLAGTPRESTGNLTLRLYLRGRGDSRDELRESIVGRGDVRIDSVELGGSRFLAKLSTLLDKPSMVHVGTVSSLLTIKSGRVVSDKLTIDLGQAAPAEFAGWTDFDGRVDYHPRLEGLNERIQSRGQELLSRLKIDINDVASVRLRGTLDHLVLTVDGVPINEGRGLREIGHRIRDKAMR